MHATLVTIGRVLLGLFFVVSGAFKVGAYLNPEAMAGLSGYIGAHGLPQPQLIAYGTPIFEIATGLLLTFGILTTPVAFIMALFCLATAGLFHNFWAVPAEQMQGQLADFLKNIALAGAYLVVAGEGIRVRVARVMATN